MERLGNEQSVVILHVGLYRAIGIARGKNSITVEIHICTRRCRCSVRCRAELEPAAGAAPPVKLKACCQNSCQLSVFTLHITVSLSDRAPGSGVRGARGAGGTARATVHRRQTVECGQRPRSTPHSVSQWPSCYCVLVLRAAGAAAQNRERRW